VIVAAARLLLAEDGLVGVSLRRLASGLGVTAPALYAYFESKDDLLAAVAAEEFAELFVALQDSTAGLADPIDRMVAQSHAYVEHLVEHPVLFDLMTVFRPGTIPQPAATELSSASKSFDESSIAIRDAMAAGLLRETDPLLVGLTLWSAVHGVTAVLLSRPNLGRDYEAALVDSVIRSVVDGLRV